MLNASAQFIERCQEYALELTSKTQLYVSAYIESKPLTAPSVKQHLAALRGLFNWLVIKQVIPDNPALFVKEPKFSRQIGITPIMETERGLSDWCTCSNGQAPGVSTTLPP